MIVFAGHSCNLGNTHRSIGLHNAKYVDYDQVRMFFLLQKILTSKQNITICHSTLGGRIPFDFAEDNWHLGIVLRASKVERKVWFAAGKIGFKGDPCLKPLVGSMEQKHNRIIRFPASVDL